MPRLDRARPLTVAEVADLFAVDPRTVKRWAEGGLIPYFRTPGGHWRFDRADVLQLVEPYRRALDDLEGRVAESTA